MRFRLETLDSGFKPRQSERRFYHQSSVIVISRGVQIMKLAISWRGHAASLLITQVVKLQHGPGWSGVATGRGGVQTDGQESELRTHVRILSTDLIW